MDHIEAQQAVDLIDCAVVSVYPPASTLPAKPKLKGNSSAFVEIAKKVQIKLMAENLYRGSVDGIIGPKTREGILIYQSRNSLPLTGQIDNALLLKMNIR